MCQPRDEFMRQGLKLRKEMRLPSGGEGTGPISLDGDGRQIYAHGPSDLTDDDATH